MDDLISRQEVLDVLHDERMPRFGAICKVKQMKTLDTAPSRRRWIPTSRRLPDLEVPVFLFFPDGRVSIGYYHYEEKPKAKDLVSNEEFTDEAIAWMPIDPPKPIVKQRGRYWKPVMKEENDE